MATNLAQVKVSRVEAGNGFLISCDRCGPVAMRPFRLEADEIAIHHRASHNHPDPADRDAA